MIRSNFARSIHRHQVGETVAIVRNASGHDLPIKSKVRILEQKDYRSYTCVPHNARNNDESRKVYITDIDFHL